LIENRWKGGIEITGLISEIRAIEDAIRTSKKYTEGLATLRQHHPVQGEDFPSKVVTKHYEVYPDMKVSMDMLVGDALDLLWDEKERIKVTFCYDYRKPEGSVQFKSQADIDRLCGAIPGLKSSVIKCSQILPKLKTPRISSPVLKSSRTLLRKLA